MICLLIQILILWAYPLFADDRLTLYMNGDVLLSYPIPVCLCGDAVIVSSLTQCDVLDGQATLDITLFLFYFYVPALIICPVVRESTPVLVLF